MVFSICTARKVVGVAAGPVRDVQVAAQARDQVARDLPRLEQIMQLEPHARSALSHAVELLRVLEMMSARPESYSNIPISKRPTR